MTALRQVSIEKNQQPAYVPLPRLEPRIQHRQKTIAQAVSCQGIGVHSGAPVNLTLCPAKADTGVVFVRTDLGGIEVKADWNTVVDTRLCTTIGNGKGVTISTIEHLMAALAASEIDNVRIEVDGPELPIMDGSAHPFVTLVDQAGVENFRVPRRMIRILKTVTVMDGDRSASLSPSKTFEIAVDFDFGDRSNLAQQTRSFRPLSDDFAKDISQARTFGHLADAEKLWAMGLSKGASLKNTLVFDGSKVINEEGLRYEDECVRHKILDALGDLHLAGALIMGKFHGVRTGHGLHNKLLRALFADPSAYSIA